MENIFIKPKVEEHKDFVTYKKRESTEYLVVHCAATQNLNKYDWKTIDRMHRQRGFISIGYHYVILHDGTIQRGRPIDSVGAHAYGYNNCSLGICLIGGIDSEGNSEDNFTAKQKESLVGLLTWLTGEYPEADVLGHRDLPNVAKDCPCFDVTSWFSKHKHEYKRYTGLPLEPYGSNSVKNIVDMNPDCNFNVGDYYRVK